MNVIGPVVISNLVRADSEKAESGFRKWDEDDETYDYYLPLRKNFHFDFNFTDSSREGTKHNFVPVLNIKTDRIGIVPINEMVEPVELEVNVKGKE